MKSSRPAASSASGFVAYSPLGRGFLTGRFKTFEDLPADDFRRTNPRFQGENFPKNLDLVRRVEALAREKRCTPSQVALAWLLAQGPDSCRSPARSGDATSKRTSAR
jgi:aryl-alcohol dehydrogenase-like predicted oxidoreductase